MILLHADRVPFVRRLLKNIREKVLEKKIKRHTRKQTWVYYALGSDFLSEYGRCTWKFP